MRNASAGLIALLNGSKEFAVCDVLTIVLASGTPLRYTSADVPITIVSQYDGNSHLFTNAGPPFTRGETKLVRGLADISALSLVINGRQGVDTVAGVPWPQAAATGLLDGAVVCLEKVIAPSFSDMSNGTLIQFLGTVGVAKPSRNSVEIEVRSPIDRLQAQFPRNVYQPTCLHTLYDAGCTLVKATFGVNGTVVAGTTLNVILAVLAQATGYFDLGTITFTSGALNGKTFPVRYYALGGPNSQVQLIKNMPALPSAGDTFTVFPGCDKLQNTCTTKFSNLVHHRGFGYIPKVEVAR